MNPENATETWSPFAERGRDVEARILSFPFEWNDKKFERGAVAVRARGETRLLGVYSPEDFADRYVQPPEHQDPMVQLHLHLLGFVRGCDEHLAETGVSTKGKQVERMAPDILMRLQRRGYPRALVLRALASAMLILLKPKPKDPAQVRVVGKPE